MSNTDRGQAFLVVMVPLSVFTTDMYLCSFRAIGDHFQVSPSILQLTLSVYLSGMAVFALISPVFAERFGPRKILTSGLLTYLLGTAFSLFSSSIALFIVGRFLQSFGGACTSVITRGMASQRPILLSYMFTSMSLSALIAPLLGGYLHTTLGWRANFVFMGLLGTVCWLFSLSFKEEKREERATLSVVGEMKALFFHAEFLFNTLLVIGAWCGFMSFVSGAPFFLLYGCGVTPGIFSILYSLAMVGFIAGTFFSRKYKSVQSFGNGFILMGSGLLLAVFAFPYAEFFILSSFFYLLGMGIQLPKAQIAAIQGLKKNHHAFGVMYFIMMLGGALMGRMLSRQSHQEVALSIALLGFFVVLFDFTLRSYFFSRTSLK